MALALAAAISPEPRETPPPALSVADGDEYFALELAAPATPDGKPPAPRTVGVARWTRRGGPSVMLELEARFFDEHTRVHHVERIDERGGELVWREWRAGQGRTLRARLASGTLEIVEWGQLEARRESLEAPRDLVFPLQAVELARDEAAHPSWSDRVWKRFDPLGRRVEPTTSKRSREGQLERVAFSGPDGVCTGLFAFEGCALRWFQWQGGELRARGVDAEEHARLQRSYESSLAER